MALSTQPYKGARDFYPEDERLQKYLFSTMRRVVERFGYEECDAPILEPFELYAAKSGEEIVNEQTYSFEDQGGRKVAIRPEWTPTISRMVAARRQELAYPLRLYAIPNLWRYERPQRGRMREHWQLNVDLFGISGIEAEHEIIQIADHLMRAFNAEREMYAVKLNSRKFMNFIFEEYLRLDAVQTHSMAKLVDRMHKMEQAAFIAQVDALCTPSQREEGLVEKALAVLQVNQLRELPSELKTHTSIKELERLLELLAVSGVTNAHFDITVMRGFDYYTDIVFEVFDTHPDNNRSMFGGGRYDGLIGLFGVEPVPTIGFGMGDVTLANFLELHELLPTVYPETDVYAVLIGDKTHERAQRVLSELREAGLNVAVDFSDRKLGNQLKTAAKKGIQYVLIIGEKELTERQYTLKNLATGDEEQHSLSRLVSIIEDYRKR